MERVSLNAKRALREKERREEPGSNNVEGSAQGIEERNQVAPKVEKRILKRRKYEAKDHQEMGGYDERMDRLVEQQHVSKIGDCEGKVFEKIDHGNCQEGEAQGRCEQHRDEEKVQRKQLDRGRYFELGDFKSLARQDAAEEIERQIGEKTLLRVKLKL